jgi:KDO2-lipid IV(A) lauroyltransferase
MKRLRQFLLFAAMVAVTFPFAVLPYRIALKVGDALGLLAYVLWKSRRTIAIDNLRRAAARGAIELDRDPASVIRQNFRNFGRSFIEVIKIYCGFGDRIFRSVEVRGAEHVARALEKGRGALLITAHCGNWELLALYASLNVTPINIVARRQNNEFFNRFIERTRAKYGNRLIYKEGALKKILAALKKNEMVGILIDQSVIRAEGIVVPFLGRNAYAMRTPALIARKTGTPVVPAFIRRTESGHVIEAGAEIPLDTSGDSDEALMQDTVNFLRPVEDFVSKYPAEWLWIHRRWKRIKE